LSAEPGAVGRWAPVVAWAAAIFLASTSWFAGSRTESVIVPLLAWLFPHADPHALETTHAVLRKLGHFTEYLVLGVLIARALRDERGWQLHHALMAFALATSYAVTDELHQHFVPGRTAAVGDVGIDALGASAGQIAMALRRVRARRPSAPA
jgi:VanZ family protein